MKPQILGCISGEIIPDFDLLLSQVIKTHCLNQRFTVVKNKMHVVRLRYENRTDPMRNRILKPVTQYVSLVIVPIVPIYSVDSAAAEAPHSVCSVTYSIRVIHPRHRLYLKKIMLLMLL